MAVSGPYISTPQVASSVPFDDSTGKGFNTPSISDVQAALEHLRDHTILDSRTQATTASGTLTLTSSDLNAQILTGTATGYSVVLPNATTLSLSAYYRVFNQSSQNVNIKDGSGAVLFVLGQSSIGHAFLQLNGTTAGSWIWWQSSVNTANGIISYNIISSTSFSSSAAVDTLITGMSVVPQAGTYGIWANFELTGTGSGQQVGTTIYNGASAITDSKRSNLSTSGIHIFSSSTQTIATFNGTNSCALYVNPNGNSFTVGARSLLMIRLGT